RGPRSRGWPAARRGCPGARARTRAAVRPPPRPRAPWPRSAAWWWRPRPACDSRRAGPAVPGAGPPPRPRRRRGAFPAAAASSRRLPRGAGALVALPRRPGAIRGRLRAVPAGLLRRGGGGLGLFARLQLGQPAAAEAGALQAAPDVGAALHDLPDEPVPV